MLAEGTFFLSQGPVFSPSGCYAILSIIPNKV